MFSLPAIIHEIEKTTKQKLVYSKTTSTPISGAAVDSRNVKPGNLFFALPGAKTDGHNFLSQAAAQGAAAAVVSKDYNGESFGLLLIKADDALEALQGFAKALIDQRKPRIVAVTGSVGKTTTKEFLSTLLRKKYRVASSPGNNNTQVGLPLTIINHASDRDEILVLEMGMTTKGHISKLVQIAPPEIAIITTVALAHAGNFTSLEDIAFAKAEIFSHSKTRLGILSKDIAAFEAISQIGAYRKISFSTKDASADYFLQAIPSHLEVITEGKIHQLPLIEILGRHNLHNLLAAVTAARSCDMSWNEISSAMSELKLPERRLEKVEKNGITFINDSYNASILSMKAALESLPKPAKGCKTIAVLGEMPELGAFSEECHRELGEFSLKYVDLMLCLDQACQPIWQAWTQANREVNWYHQFDELSAAVWKMARPGDVVLIKGANFLKLWRILEESLKKN